MAYSTQAAISPTSVSPATVSPSYYGLFKGSFLTLIVASVNQLLTAVNLLITAVNQISGVGQKSVSIGTAAAAGATQGTATLLGTSFSVFNVSTTTSSEGVKLPTAATGLMVTILAPTAHGVKVYANATGQSIGTGTTNTTALSVAANTGVDLYAISATKWRLGA